MRPEGKRAIVTGAGSAFSAGIARAFLAEGAKVIIADIAGGMAEAVAARAGGIAHQVDVADGRSIARLAERAQDAMGGIDTLVNNAGITHQPGAMEEIDAGDSDRIFAVNCESIYLTARALVPAMKAARAGTILTAASTAALSRPLPRLNCYNGSKGWGVIARKAMAVELASIGIRVDAPHTGRGRHAAPESVSRRGDTKNAREVPVDDPARAVLDIRGDGHGRALSLIGRGGDGGLNGAGNGWRAMHLRACS